MNYIYFICLIPVILSSSSSSYNNIYIQSDDDCWADVNNNTINKNYAFLVRFAPKIAYGQHGCSVHIASPWLTHMQNGFGLFLSQEMDCSSTVTVDCLSDSTLTNQTLPSPVKLTCHTSADIIEMPCSSISLTFKRTISAETKKPTYVQVVALIKKPCFDDNIFFQCPNDYPNSCLDKKLQCNGRSECPSKDDERDCDRQLASTSFGASVVRFFLAILAFLIVVCIISTVLICCCCRVAFNGLIRSFRSEKRNKFVEKGDMTSNGEDAGLIKGLTAQPPPTVVELLPRQHVEPAPLMIDSTKPIYPRLE